MLEALKMKSLVPWFGADGAVAAMIGRQLDGCEWVGIPCVGGCGVIPHIGARSILAADVHRHLVNLANVARDKALGPKLYRAVRRLPMHPEVLEAAQSRCISREEATRAKAEDSLFGAAMRAVQVGRAELGLPDLVKDAARSPDLDWAIDYFVCCLMGQGGRAGTDKEFEGGMSFRWNAGGGSSVVRFRSAAAGLKVWRHILERCEFQVLDVLEFLRIVRQKELADANKPREKRAKRGVYLDCPWPDDGAVYKHTFGEEKQIAVARAVAELKDTRVVIRYGDHPLIRRLYPQPQYTLIPQTSRTQGNNQLAELLIVNGPVVAGEVAA